MATKSKSANTVHVTKSAPPKTVKTESVNQAVRGNPHGDTPHGRKRLAAETKRAAEAQLKGA